MHVGYHCYSKGMKFAFIHYSDVLCMCIHCMQVARTLNAKTIYCGHNAVVEVCTMLDIKGITLFIEKFNLGLLALLINESVYVKVSRKILDSTTDQFQHAQSTYLNGSKCILLHKCSISNNI